MFGKKDEPTPPPQAPQPPRQPLWQDIPDQCAHCGARVNQAEEIYAPQPKCAFCNEPLPCKPVPPPQSNAINTGYTGPFADLVNGAIGASMQQANAFFAPGGMANQYAANQVMTGGMAFDATSYLATSGKPARGTVTSWNDMGIDMGTGRVMQVSVNVPNDSGTTYPASCKTIVPTQKVQGLAQGMTVSLRVDQADPYTIRIMWEES